MFEIKDDEEIKKGKKMKKDVVCTLVFCEYHFYCILSVGDLSIPILYGIYIFFLQQRSSSIDPIHCVLSTDHERTDIFAICDAVDCPMSGLFESGLHFDCVFIYDLRLKLSENNKKKRERKKERER